MSESFFLNINRDIFLNEGIYLQSEYIVNNSGRGPIFEYTISKIVELNKTLDTTKKGDKATPVKSRLSNNDLYEKQLLYNARLYKQMDMFNNKNSNLRRKGGSELNDLNVNNPKETLNNIETMLGNIRGFNVNLLIIVLEGVDGGHVIAVKMSKNSIIYFDPDVGQYSSSDLKALMTAIEYINSLLKLHFISFEFFTIDPSVKADMP
ncbi:hypothetical protein [Bacteroides timonensis]|uniref:hypothetical protein n=1 Tax=Bacteroides timonensis TaxID=1470345 RepID=UPI0004B6BE67|nr:hypothetical protein [Bacteroides timonensis]